MGTPDTAFVKQFKDTVTLLAQQRDSRMSAGVIVDNDFVGEEKFYEQYASDDMVELLTRYQDTPIQNPDHRRRLVRPSYFVSNTLEDPKDALQMLIDPKSAYMQAKMASANRRKDLTVIQAMGGTAKTGKAGGTDQALTLTVAAGAAGLTKNKILEASRKLNAGEVDVEDRFLVHSAIQLEDLLKTTEVASSDFNTVKALVQGELKTWIGFQFIHSEQLETSGSNRLLFAWQKKGVLLAIQKDNESRVTERPDKNYAWQVYIRLALGSTRLEEARVVQIACVEA